MSTKNTDGSTTGLPIDLLGWMVVLESFARTKRTCHPSTETLVRMSRRSRRQVMRDLAQLESLGWIAREPIPGQSGRTRRIVLLRRLSETPEPIEVVAGSDGSKVPGWHFDSAEMAPPLNKDGLNYGRRSARTTAEVSAVVRMIPDSDDEPRPEEDAEPPRRRPSSVHAGTLPPKAARPPRSVTD